MRSCDLATMCRPRSAGARSAGYPRRITSSGRKATTTRSPSSRTRGPARQYSWRSPLDPRSAAGDGAVLGSKRYPGLIYAHKAAFRAVGRVTDSAGVPPERAWKLLVGRRVRTAGPAAGLVGRWPVTTSSTRHTSLPSCSAGVRGTAVHPVSAAQRGGELDVLDGRIGGTARKATRRYRRSGPHHAKGAEPRSRCPNGGERRGEDRGLTPRRHPGRLTAGPGFRPARGRRHREPAAGR
jgi:hypothetical protein